MTRFKELRRIEAAIENCDSKELIWARDYCAMRIKVANQLGLSGSKVKSQTTHWQKLIDRINDSIGSAK